ncbi:MAG: hypothetical protein HRT68_03450, partial [Flavobacteriaceae bacterium]|nr:hypothetical protein [Flavobacteriaceae bacterium]
MLNKRSIEDIYTLSPFQQGILFHHLFKSEDDVSYIVQLAFDLSGEIDMGDFENAVREMFFRHDVLRTIFVYKKIKQPIQVVLKKESLVSHKFLDFYDLTSGDLLSFKKFMKDDLEKGFNLSSDLSMRVSLLKVGHNKYKIVWTHHHIILDGWCMGIILNEFFTIYNSYKNKRKYVLKPPVPFKNFIKWYVKEDKKLSKLFWVKYLEGFQFNHITTLPKNKNKTSREQKCFEFELDNHNYEKLEKFSRNNKISKNSIIQCTWGILLILYNNTDDVIYGTVNSGRTYNIRDIERIIGPLINAIPVRVQWNPKETLLDLLNKINLNSQKSINHQYLPLTEMMEFSSKGKPLFDHFVLFNNYPSDGELGNPDMESNEIDICFDHYHGHTHSDFSIIIKPLLESILIQFWYKRDCFDSQFVKNISEYFIYIFDILMTSPLLKKEEFYEKLGIKIKNKGKYRYLINENNKEQEEIKEHSLEDYYVKAFVNDYIVENEDIIVFSELNDAILGILKKAAISSNSNIIALQDLESLKSTLKNNLNTKLFFLKSDSSIYEILQKNNKLKVFLYYDSQMNFLLNNYHNDISFIFGSINQGIFIGNIKDLEDPFVFKGKPVPNELFELKGFYPYPNS